MSFKFIRAQWLRSFHWWCLKPTDRRDFGGAVELHCAINCSCSPRLPWSVHTIISQEEDDPSWRFLLMGTGDWLVTPEWPGRPIEIRWLKRHFEFKGLIMGLFWRSIHLRSFYGEELKTNEQAQTIGAGGGGEVGRSFRRGRGWTPMLGVKGAIVLGWSENARS